MAAEANRHFLALVSGQRELLLLDNEYRSQAIRDSKLGARYVGEKRSCAPCSRRGCRRA